jgi:membrane protease YdiL (CAAX protease family)
LSGKRYLLIEIAVVMGLLWLPAEWTGARDAFLRPFDYVFQADCIARIINYSAGVAILLFLLWAVRQSFERFGICRVKVRDIAIFAAGLALVLIVEVALAAVWRRFVPSTFAMPSYKGPARSWPAPFFLFLSFIPSGVYQELLMRGYLITRLEDLWASKWVAFAISCILFGAWHLYEGGEGTVVSTAVGAVFGLLFLRYRRVWPLAAAHAALNILIRLHVVSHWAHLLSG